MAKIIYIFLFIFIVYSTTFQTMPKVFLFLIIINSISEEKKKKFLLVLSTSLFFTLKEQKIERKGIEWSTVGFFDWCRSKMAEDHQTRNKYSIIIPTYNERLNVALIVYLVFKHLSYYHFSLYFSFCVFDWYVDCEF